MDFDGVIPLISESDILLLSSVEEGVPNVILEAMALGTVVVSTDCGAVREIITDGENGFLVPVRDPRAIADMVRAVAELCECELGSGPNAGPEDDRAAARQQKWLTI